MTPWPANLPAAPVQFDRLAAIYLAIVVVAIIYTVWVLRRALKPEPPSETETEYERFLKRQREKHDADLLRIRQNIQSGARISRRGGDEAA